MIVAAEPHEITPPPQPIPSQPNSILPLAPSVHPLVPPFYADLLLKGYPANFLQRNQSGKSNVFLLGFTKIYI